jgi:hypothetical protein
MLFSFRHFAADEQAGDVPAPNQHSRQFCTFAAVFKIDIQDC